MLSAIVLALIPLMRPHVWQGFIILLYFFEKDHFKIIFFSNFQGAFIPIVPSDLLDALHCPVPYVMGIFHFYSI